MKHIVILGNGIAGITAARHIRKLSDHKITVISGESEHFFSRTALMYIYMGHMKYEHTKPYEDWFWRKNNIDLKMGWVEQVDFDRRELQFNNGEAINYDQLILATGSNSNKFGWKGQDLKGVQGLYSLQDLELMEQNTQNIERAVIVGGGLIGVEMAEMLHSRNIPVTYLIRESHFWDIVLPDEEASMIDRHLREHHIDLRTNTELLEIIDDGEGKVKAVKTNDNETIPCQFVGLTVGVHPNINLFKYSTLEIDKGILVDELLKTNLPDVYAIGDCAQLKSPSQYRKSIEAVWYVGRKMGETVAKTICGTPTVYNPGVWFNSAKFFDIEYQTYGSVPPYHSSSFYWEHADGKKAMRIVFNENYEVEGVNFMGLRQRHEVWDRWIRDGKTLQYVMEHLTDAHFDPELFRRHEQEIQSKYNGAFPDHQVTIRKKGFLEKILN
ncbi:NAD(P)/FAD-dependent oxidoreductase [Marinoscillum sp. MHG1-6]|uniref:NAD(P)/FAD-dependent oxidoreductase n=1 Tax=Marinoscillum sp. MHG1-6 TaxID=2959627 RepID=UPI0021584160|nr:NAD(P)/FAD-dependent oxidoreductase [Marinoscillum sp. MHG1-6]